MQFAGSTPPPHLPPGAIHSREGLAPVSPDQLDLNSDLLRTTGRGGGVGGCVVERWGGIAGRGTKVPTQFKNNPLRASSQPPKNGFREFSTEN